MNYKKKYSSQVKLIDDNIIKGKLVTFTDAEHPDLDGDYFDINTWFGFAKKTSIPIFYQHGYDEVINNIQIGRGTLQKTQSNLWLQSQLEIRNEYLEYINKYLKSDDSIEEFFKAIKELVNMKALGLSSGAVGGLARFVPKENSKGDIVYHINQWIVGEASLTPNPAEPSNLAVKNINNSIKSLLIENKKAKKHKEYFDINIKNSILEINECIKNINNIL